MSDKMFAGQSPEQQPWAGDPAAKSAVVSKDEEIKQLKQELHDRTLRFRESIEATNQRINEHHRTYEKTISELRAEVERLKAEIERLKKMNNVTVKREELLGKVRANRDAHRSLFLKAQGTVLPVITLYSAARQT